MAWGYLVLVVIYLVVLAVTVIVGASNYNSLSSSKYSFLNCFPFEMNDKPRMRFNFLFRCLLALLAAAYAVPVIFMLKDNDIFLIRSVMILGIFLALSMISIFLIDLRYYKTHCVAAIFFFILSVAFNGFVGYTILIFPQYRLYKIFPFIMFALSLLIIGLVLNPKLKQWMRLAVDENGNLQRPRISLLAFTEWLVILIDTLSLILMATGIKA